MSIKSVSALLSAILLLGSTESSSFFKGSLMTFSSRNNPDGSYLVDIRFKQTYYECDLGDNWSCKSGNCGTNSYVSGRVDSSSNDISWCQTEGVMKRTVPNNSPFELFYSFCCWINNKIKNDGDILLLTHIDLGERSDTFQPNSSPVVTALPIVRVPQNCPRNYNFLSYDQDHDQVQCRYGNLSANECGICNQPVGFTLNQSTCTLSYDSSSEGFYVFELVMEDYPIQSISLSYTAKASVVRTPFVNGFSNTPLSRIPLQFSLEVEAPAPSCTEGEYLPRFIHPTPLHGEHLQARVNQELEIRVMAEATYSIITDVVFSGRMNSKKVATTTTGEYLIKWTPTPENYGQHFPICFIAVGQAGFRDYQTEMRCVIVMVEAQGPRSEVTCTRDTMSVSIKRDTFSGIHGDHLRLNNNASCLVYSNSTHVFTTFPLNGCGTQMEETEEHLLFKNTIVTFDNPNDIITRKNETGIEFICEYPKNSSITTRFDAHRPAVNISERGFGSFSYQFEFYQSGSFINMKNPNIYPLEYDAGQPIYMKIEPVSLVQNTEVFLESCVASPYDSPNYPISYPIITNGCGVDETVYIYTSHEPRVKFRMEAFKFIGQYDQVFISCSIIICQANNPNTRCAQGCSSGSVVGPSSLVHKREAAIQTGRHFISQGPLRLRRSASLTEAIGRSLNLNLVFVTGCVVAVVAMVCGMMVYKSRGSKVNYQLLRTDEI